MTTTPEINPASVSPPPLPDHALTLDLPSTVVAAGKRTTLSFFFAHTSYVRGLRWVPGFRLERLILGSKDFGNGTITIADRHYRDHLVLKGEQLQLHLLNDTGDDRTFAGSITLEMASVPESAHFSCSPEGGDERTP